MNPRISPLDLAHPATLAALYGILQCAYAQESSLLGLSDFPPLTATEDDLAAAPWRFRGAWDGATLLGALAADTAQEGGENIALLIVDPARQRAGIARRLLQSLLDDSPGMPLFVSTAAGNMPALRLYAQFGFREMRRWRIDGAGSLELVRLVRLPAA